jgi:AcrR family transcriptional regulator
MGAPSGPRAANVAETREKILRAAIGQFSRHGFAGARVDSICVEAGINPRMIYHYFSDKAGLYLAVLEQVLGELRIEELKLEVDSSEPLEGLLTMFEFTFRHFAGHPELIRLLSAENLMEAEILKSSESTPTVASPVIGHITVLLQKGAADGSVKKGIDPLHLYVMMVALSYFHKSNAYTLGIIFKTDLTTETWQEQHFVMMREVLRSYLRCEG